MSILQLLDNDVQFIFTENLESIVETVSHFAVYFDPMRSPIKAPEAVKLP